MILRTSPKICLLPPTPKYPQPTYLATRKTYMFPKNRLPGTSNYDFEFSIQFAIIWYSIYLDLSNI